MAQRRISADLTGIFYILILHLQYIKLLINLIDYNLMIINLELLLLHMIYQNIVKLNKTIYYISI